MEPHTELIDALPRLFAKDLNAAMAQQEELKRIVLFFDAHEAFWGHQRDLPEEVFFQRDEWLRCLLRALDLSAGIVAVVAGREKPRWAEATRSAIPQQYLDTQLVGHFSPTDARDYLQKADIKDAALQQSLIDYASVAAEEVHPLYLGLCADVVLAARAQGKFLTPDDFPTAPETPDKSKALINRLLRYVDKEVEVAVHALSACRAFDFELYLKLGQALHFHATHPAFFDILTRFSFVWQAQRQGENWYRIHDLLRRLDDESRNEITRCAHEVLEQHYRERGEVAEAIYHANRLDWERGVKEWVRQFDQVLQQSRYQQCRTLLEVRSEMLIQSNFRLGIISQFEGDYFERVARHDEAQQEYLEAIAAYDQALNNVDNTFQVYNNKGSVLFKLGQLHAELSRYQKAWQSYEQAIAIYDQALDLSPESVSAHNNKGLVLQSLGRLQAGRSKHQEALQSYEQAIATYDQTLNLDPGDVFVYNNKGIVVQGLGELLAGLLQYEKALRSYKQAITTCDQALLLTADFVPAHTNKGNALSSLGELQAKCPKYSSYQEALRSYEQGITAYNQALKFAPDDTYILNNKGNALSSLGELQANLLRHQEALQSYEKAITTCDQVLSLAPNFVPSHINRGNALSRLGKLQENFSKYQEALQSYGQAIRAYNQAISQAPSLVQVRNNKGLVLHSLGFLQARLSLQMKLLQNREARESWQAAVAEFSLSLEIVPGDEYIRNVRDLLQKFLDNL
ncbi:MULTISPECIES: tetratricopeptide repeat protein [unclassified Coleofasciculus]|uniref:tetratricopeptide repeat protein n=1 Tax=unclassified Coleofasciculus TaxID=2692782 RepID=UPI001D14F78D|nr:MULTISPECIES: tetratricopeptide repeat protein [unclassified Coleofasciculus]